MNKSDKDSELPFFYTAALRRFEAVSDFLPADFPVSFGLSDGKEEDVGEIFSRFLCAVMIHREGEPQDLALENVLQAFGCFESRSIKEVMASERGRKIKRCLSLISDAMFLLSFSELLDKAEVEAKREAPLNDINNNNKFVRDRAREIAKQEWEKDLECKIRTGKMAKIVADKLVDEKLDGGNPWSLGQIRAWLDEVRPEYAKKRGRPKSSQGVAAKKLKSESL